MKLTPLQREVLAVIVQKPGEDPGFLAMLAGTNVSGFGRAAHALQRKQLAYRSTSFGKIEWWPTERGSEIHAQLKVDEGGS